MKSFLSVILFSVLLSLGGLSAQTHKFGHINFQQLLQVMPERETAQKALDKVQMEMQKQLEVMQKELQDKSKDYIAQQQTLSDAIRATKEDDINSLNQRIQTFQQTASQNLQNEHSKQFQPVIEKARKAISDVGKEQGMIYVFEAENGFLYNSEQSINILALVKTKLGIK